MVTYNETVASHCCVTMPETHTGLPISTGWVVCDHPRGSPDDRSRLDCPGPTTWLHHTR